MSNEDNDQHLKNLQSEGGPPPPKRSGGGKKKGKRPNKGRQPRISARRIGGPNYQKDFEAYKAAKLKQMPIAPANLGGTVSSARNSNTFSSTLPRVQELGPTPTLVGPTVSSRRSSSKFQLPITGRNRASSAGSSFSGTHTEGTKLEKGEKEIIIRYGELFKKAVITKQWKKRFFVLTQRRLLYYVDSFDVPQELHQIEQTPKGQLELSLIQEVKRDKEKEKDSFTVVAPSRTYHLRTDRAKYAVDAWVAALRGACENARQHQHLNTKIARSSFASYKVDEVDEAMHSAATFKHPTKRLIDSEKFLVAAHKPASLEDFGEWVPFDVAAWLWTVHLQKYSELFYQQGIDGKNLKAIHSKDDAKNLGVEEEDLEDFMDAVSRLKAVEETEVQVV